jgi:hypothetical protein
MELEAQLSMEDHLHAQEMEPPSQGNRAEASSGAASPRHSGQPDLVAPLPGPCAPFTGLPDVEEHDVEWRRREADHREHPWCERPRGGGRQILTLPPQRRLVLARAAGSRRPGSALAVARGTAPLPPEPDDDELERRAAAARERGRSAARASEECTQQERLARRARWLVGLSARKGPIRPGDADPSHGEVIACVVNELDPRAEARAPK